MPVAYALGTWEAMDLMERHARLKEIFLKALDVELRQLPAFLDEACGDDDALRRDLESLLRYHLATDRQGGSSDS